MCKAGLVSINKVFLFFCTAGPQVPHHTVRMLRRQVYALASEDMDSLTFQTPHMVRHLMAQASQKLGVNEFDYDKVLNTLVAPLYAGLTTCISLLLDSMCWRDLTSLVTSS